MKFTIIIPVYNVERYIEECITSVLTQTYQNYEIILIDDGSTDKSGMICDKFERNYSQVIVLHKQNGGLSSARNAGIQLSKGDYIIFLDGDDFWDDKKALEKIYIEIKKYKYDVLNFHYKKMFENNKSIVNSFSEVDIDAYMQLPLEQRKSFLVKHSQFIASACNKVVDKNLFNDNCLFFENGKTSEDINWCARLLISSKNIGVCNEKFYIYRQREKSITHSVQMKNLIDLNKNIQNCINIFEQTSLSKYELEACYNYISYIYCTSLVCYQYVEDLQKKKLISELKRKSFLLNYHWNKKVYIFYIINKFFGFRILLFIIKIYSYIHKL